jgi:hypothetical protein
MSTGPIGSGSVALLVAPASGTASGTYTKQAQRRGYTQSVLVADEHHPQAFIRYVQVLKIGRTIDLLFDRACAIFCVRLRVITCSKSTPTSSPSRSSSSPSSPGAATVTAAHPSTC